MLRLLKNWLDTALGEPGGIPEVEEDVLRARRLASYQVFTISYKVLREFNWTARLVSSFVEGQVTEVVEGKAWVVPGVLSPEVSQLSVGSPFFTFTMSSWWGQTNYDFGQYQTITTSISITNTTITNTISITLVISPSIASKIIIN